MRLNVMSRAWNIVWNKPFGLGLFTRRAVVLMGPVRVDLWAL